MEKRQINITAQSIDELQILLEECRNMGAGSFVKPFRAHCEKHQWDWFGLEPKKLFDYNARLLISAFGHSRYANERLGQLVEGNFAFWIFKAEPDCPDEHVSFDRISLPPDHGFWQRYMPPLGWECGCYVVGASSAAAVVRLNGDLDKPLPGWWSRIDPATELPAGVEEPWGMPDGPDLLLLLAAIIDGHAPQPDFG